MAVVGPGQRVDEGEVDDFGDQAEEMVLGDEAVKGQLVLELGREAAEAHHGLLPPSRGQAAHMDHIIDQISRRVRQQAHSLSEHKAPWR